MNLLSNKNYNISYTDIFCSFGPLPKNMNLLDKEEIIQYNGIRIPRIPLGNNNSLNLSMLLYDACQLTDLYNYFDNIMGNDKKISINIDNNPNKIYFRDNEIVKKENNNKNNNSQINNIKYLCKRKNFFNQISLNNKEFGNDKYINLAPPNKFIVILEKNININKNTMNLKEKLNDINKVILNNINDINAEYYNVINNNFPSTYLEKIKLNNVDYYSKILSNLSNFEEDSFSYSSSTDLNGNKSNSKILFEVKYISNQNKEDEGSNKNIIKRGRKQTKINKENGKVHSAVDDDNVLRKIQVHFLSFTTNYINDIIKVFAISRNMPYFKKIDYGIKKIVKHRYIECLKSMTIGEILQLRASSKMKIHDESVNRNIYKKVCSLFPFMEAYLQRNIVSLFKEYYYNKSKIFIVNGKVIPLSLNTKTFNDLINKNYAYKEKFKRIATNYFLNNNKKKKNPIYFIDKNQFGYNET